jgi:ubiquinone/menaquinone biosynthesis C-methylase UbiE
MKVIYQKEIGYSSLENVDVEKMRRVIKLCKELIDGYYFAQPEDKILVAGAGEGVEAAIISTIFKQMTIGIDKNINFQSQIKRSNEFFLQRQDLSSLAFVDKSFSIIYCYHVLEHVDDPEAVLRELQRVLKPEGIMFIGFPNKHRLIAYLGTSQKSTLKDKIWWNINDYQYRIRGKFENRYGAHAGFTEGEYKKIASKIFTHVIPVRNEYILLKYSRSEVLGRLLIMSKLSEFLFPSNYFICMNTTKV